MANEREGAGSPFPQGRYEEIAYKFNFEKWGSGAPTGPTVTIYELKPDGEAVSSPSNLSGAASVSGDIVTTPVVLDLLPDVTYLLTCNVTIDGNKMEGYVKLLGEL